ncbi:MAG TPA: PDZ domain-containing protein [Acidimicrobiales bacterium]|nr:PDZ domain-containing protein [Acidimicrobiales bacterium]
MTSTVDRGRSGQWVASTAAVCVVGALLVGGLLMANTGASPTSSPHTTATTTADEVVSPTTEQGAGDSITKEQMAQTVSTIGPSMVALTVTVAGRSIHSTGVTVESGGLVVALASAVAGATSITTVDPDGRRTSAAVLASDQNSNLAILRVNSNLPVAQFSDDADMKPGDATVAVAPEPRANQAGLIDAVYAGTVRSSGTAVNADATTSAMSATAVNAPLGAGDAGCAMINHAGAVTGIMDTTTTMKGRRVSVFLPADLVVGVATQLIATGTVRHGWLGVDASDLSASTSAPGATTATTATTAATGGALVDTVQPDGAAARAGIQVGDSIVDIDGRPVRSLADLRTRLYADPPGSTLTVTYDRNGATATVGVELTGTQAAASPTS